MDADRTQDLVAKAKHEGFDSGAAWMLLLKMPVESITPEEAPGYFGWMAQLATIDVAASSALTREQLGWNPTGPDLLTDLRNMDYIEA